MAAGPAAVAWALRHAVGEMGPSRAARALGRVNQADGFDCPGCAWPEGEHRAQAEFCENGAKAVAEEATRRRADRALFARHSVEELTGWSDFRLGRAGRLTEPMLLDAGASHYAPVAWDEAFGILAEELGALGSPDEAVFYTSGRTSNEAAFAYQLFVRAFGTNNLPDCSNMCHESAGMALGETLGVGKGSVSLEDLHDAELILVVGQNYDVIGAIEAMGRGEAKLFFALGGNFFSAAPDSDVTAAALRRQRLTVHVSTKLNRSHLVTGRRALILPTLGRTERDVQASGPQQVTVEDSMSNVHASRGRLQPASDRLLSEVAIVCRLAHAVLGESPAMPWSAFEADYGLLRDRIAQVVAGFEDFNARLAASETGFTLPHPPRDQRRFPTATGRARLSVNSLEVLRVPPGRLLLQTMRSHDQYNTTIYGLNDRYRGIKAGRRVVLVHPDDLAERGLADGDLLDIVGEWHDGERRVERFRAVAYPTARGCAAAYYPETNALVPLDHHADGSRTPASKSIVVRLEQTRAS